MSPQSPTAAITPTKISAQMIACCVTLPQEARFCAKNHNTIAPPSSTR
jgi:hypothetical protein